MKQKIIDLKVFDEQPVCDALKLLLAATFTLPVSETQLLDYVSTPHIADAIDLYGVGDDVYQLLEGLGVTGEQRLPAICNRIQLLTWKNGRIRREVGKHRTEGTVFGIDYSDDEGDREGPSVMFDPVGRVADLECYEDQEESGLHIEFSYDEDGTAHIANSGFVLRDPDACSSDTLEAPCWAGEEQPDWITEALAASSHPVEVFWSAPAVLDRIEYTNREEGFKDIWAFDGENKVARDVTRVAVNVSAPPDTPGVLKEEPKVITPIMVTKNRNGDVFPDEAIPEIIWSGV